MKYELTITDLINIQFALEAEMKRHPNAYENIYGVTLRKIKECQAEYERWLDSMALKERKS